MPPYQSIANVCVAIAGLLFLLPLQNLLWDYAHKKAHTNGWEPAVLFILVPLWLLLMGALLCVTASGGFDWLRLGRRALYALTVAAALALAVVSFVLVAMCIQPGFAPRIIFFVPLFLVHLGTLLVVVMSLNPQLAFGFSPQVARLPWVIFAALSLVACFGFLGHRLVHMSARDVGGLGALVLNAHRLGLIGPPAQETLAKISTLDAQQDLDKLLDLAGPYQRSVVRDAATARLRTNSKFIKALAAELNSSTPMTALEFVEGASFSADELIQLALPARNAMARFIADTPASNYTTPAYRNKRRSWGQKLFPPIAKKFANTAVDFSPTLADFEEAFAPDTGR